MIRIYPNNQEVGSKSRRAWGVWGREWVETALWEKNKL
jgi:hypothetical protein